jgi:hypothetical protein
MVRFAAKCPGMLASIKIYILSAGKVVQIWKTLWRTMGVDGPYPSPRSEVEALIFTFCLTAA